jgi:hypothetical protein
MSKRSRADRDSEVLVGWDAISASARSLTRGAPIPFGFYLAPTTLTRYNQRLKFNGLFTAVDIPKGAYIGEYKGKRISFEESDSKPNNAYYFSVFEIDSRRQRTGVYGHVIDGCNPQVSSFLRYINAANHKDNINVGFAQVGIHVYAFALKPIAAHSELLASYGKEQAGVVRTVTTTCPAWPHRLVDTFVGKE